MDNREKEIYKVTLTGSAVNAVLIVLKFVAGILGRSSALVADAVHSLSDFITDVVVLVFVKIAGKPHDKSHEYGHGKFETLGTMIIGLILVIAGISLLVNGVELVIRSFEGEALPQPTWLAFGVAVASILSKEWLYRYTVRKGKEENSQAVVANAWHHRSDAISSAGTLVGVAGAMFLSERWRVLDPIAAALVSCFIIKSGIDIMRPTISELLEGSLPDKVQKEIVALAAGIKGVASVPLIRTRRIGNAIAVDLHVLMDGGLSLSEAHNNATAIEQAIKRKFGENSIVNVHMEPVGDDNDAE